MHFVAFDGRSPLSYKQQCIEASRWAENAILDVNFVSYWEEEDWWLLLSLSLYYLCGEVDDGNECLAGG